MDLYAEQKITLFRYQKLSNMLKLFLGCVNFVLFKFSFTGRKIKSEDVQPKWLSQTNNSCTSDRLSLLHGTTVYVNVKCVNNIEMSNQTYASSIIATEPTNANNAMLQFINPDVESPQMTASLVRQIYVPRHLIYTQSNHTCLQFEWTNFDDDAGVAQYEYRLLQKDVTVVDWSSTRKHTMTSLCGPHLVSDNIYTAQVRAINSGKFVSDSVDGDVLICSDEPKLSGKQKDYVNGEKPKGECKVTFWYN